MKIVEESGSKYIFWEAIGNEVWRLLAKLFAFMPDWAGVIEKAILNLFVLIYLSAYRYLIVISYLRTQYDLPGTPGDV